MSISKSKSALSAAASLALAALLASNVAASAQSALTNGPDGIEPSSLAQKPHRAKRMHMASSRPLVVRRRAAPLAPAVVDAPVDAINTGPGTLITGPLGIGSAVVGFPFHVLGGIFPANGNPGTNPLVLIGAPLRAVGDMAQVPFRIVGAPFGGTTIATY